MGHHVLRRAVNLTFAFLLAVFSVNVSGVLALQNAYAAAPGNNGTLKVHELNTPSGDEPTPGAGNNDPKVCKFNFEGFGLDANQTGDVTIEGQGATTLNPTVIIPFASNQTGYGETVYVNNGGAYTLANGHYKATLDDKFGVDNGNKAKSKVFKVDCPAPVVTTLTPTAPTFNDPCQTANDNYVIPAMTGVIYSVKVNNGSFNDVSANTYTETQGRVITVKAVAETGYTLTGTTQWSHDFTNATCPPTPATPTAPLFNDLCQAANDSFTILATTGVKYKVNGTTKSAGTYTAGFWDYIVGVNITAHAESGYTLTGTSSWYHKFTNTGCPATATQPTLINECGTHNDRFVIPEIEGVQYKVSKFGIIYLDVDAGSHWAEGTFYVKAVAKPGYTLTGNTNSWTLYLNPSLCKLDADTKFVDECGTSKDAFTIEAADHVTYKVATKWVWFIIWIPVEFEEIAPGTYTDEANGLVKVIAEADPGYYIHGEWFWIHNFNSNKCELDAVGDPTFTDECGVENDAFTIVPAANVTYKVNGAPAAATTYTYPDATGLVEITAEATDPDYVLADPTEWSHEFSEATCADITAEAFCDRTGVIVTLTNDGDTDGAAIVNSDPVAVPANDKVEVTVPVTLFKATIVVTVSDTVLIDKAFDCTPGMGGGGAPVPPVVTPAGIMLPQTGGETNALMQMLTVITAGIVTYGGVFYLVNRRNLLNNR